MSPLRWTLRAWLSIIGRRIARLPGNMRPWRTTTPALMQPEVAPAQAADPSAAKPASADVVAKALTLTAGQYADNFANLTDADSLAYVTALLERDAKIHDLRVNRRVTFAPMRRQAPGQLNRTYSKSSGCWLMPTEGGAIQLAN
ncbi:MAG TPA: hypothetical protein VE046_16370 [Steroidobacteraceae bacterium]|nr:hypothetical protein [Steroidobacteraceae bacterium]